MKNKIYYIVNITNSTSKVTNISPIGQKLFSYADKPF